MNIRNRYAKVCLFLWVLGMCLTAHSLKAQSVIPVPLKMEQGTGCFLLSENTKLYINLQGLEAQLLENCLQALPVHLKKGKKKDTQNILSLSITEKNHQLPSPESYTLSVTPQQILIRATSGAGLFYGMQTLLQLAQPSGAGSYSIASVEIEDTPRFAYRGLMLDVSRHFSTKEFIKKQIDSNKDKYDDIIAKRSEAGKRGMASRYNKDVTKDSKSNKCYHKVTNLTSDNKSNKGYQSVTNLTINDYENDNDDVLFQKEEEKVFGSSPLKPLQELFDEMKRNDSWAEGLIMNKHHEGYKAFNQETLSDFLEEFFRKLQNENCTMVNPGDEYRHFSNWLNKKLECKSDERTKTDKRTNARTGGQDYNYGHEIDPPHIIKLGGQGKV